MRHIFVSIFEWIGIATDNNIVLIIIVRGVDVGEEGFLHVLHWHVLDVLVGGGGLGDAGEVGLLDFLENGFVHFLLCLGEQLKFIFL